MKSAVFRSGPTEIVILGGVRGHLNHKGYTVYDTKKRMIILNTEESKKVVRDDDDFNNQDNIMTLKKGKVYVLSGMYA